ncbi:MAG: HAD family hydrolase [Myxococcales bacterium]|nr:HAD hydrolase-like protein [Myxococcales bacterium]
MPPKMVIFDLDGTLVDSAGEIAAAMAQAWQAVLPELPFPAERVRIGPPLAQMIANLDPALGRGEQRAVFDAFRERYDASDFSRTLPYPGIHGVVETLRAQGRRLCLATNKRLLPTLAIAARWFPRSFDKIACSDGVWPEDGTRPASKAEMVRWLAGSAADGAVVVGDTTGDIAAGRASGLRVVAVTWGYCDEQALVAARPDAVVHEVPALLGVLDRIP